MCYVYIYFDEINAYGAQYGGKIGVKPRIKGDCSFKQFVTLITVVQISQFAVYITSTLWNT